MERISVFCNSGFSYFVTRKGRSPVGIGGVQNTNYPCRKGSLILLFPAEVNLVGNSSPRKIKG